MAHLRGHKENQGRVQIERMAAWVYAFIKVLGGMFLGSCSKTEFVQSNQKMLSFCKLHTSLI